MELLNKKRFLWFRLSLFLFLMVCVTPPAHANSDQTILLLHSEGAPTGWTQGLAAGLTDGLNESMEVRQEFLGGEAMDEDHFDAVYERLIESKALLSPVAVITSGEPAFAFARKYGEDLFPGAPVIFCSMARPDPAVLNQCGQCTGIPLEHDLPGNLDLIFSLRPQTQLIVAITDNTKRGKALRATAEQAMTPYMDRAQIMFPGYEPGDDTGLDIGTLGDVLASMPSSAVVLFLELTEDRSSNPISTEQISTLFTEQNTSPTFVIDDTLLGSGVLGGVVASAQGVGREAARRIQAIQAGELVNEMLPEASPTRLVLDGTALSRFGITPPEGAIIINAPKPVEQEGEGLANSPFTFLAGILVLLLAIYVFTRLYRT